MGTRGRPRGFDRETALHRAMETFWDRGYEQTSMTDLTTAMGIASPSVYACFGSKEQLFRQAVELYKATRGGRPLRVLQETTTAREAVEGMLRANADTFADPATPRGCMIVLGALPGSTQNAGVEEFLSERRQAMRSAIKDRLDRGAAEGELPAHTDTGALAAFYLAVLEGMSIQSRDGASLAALETVITCAMAAWGTLTGIEACPRRGGVSGHGAAERGSVTRDDEARP